MTDPVLTLNDARLTLDGNAGPVDILRGITLEVTAGETLGLIGPSGSGKSSLLMLMGGLERATGGVIRALGQDLTAMDEDALARFRRDHMGVVFQSFHLIPTMTALENVTVPLELSRRGDAFARARESLEAVGLGHRLNHYPGQLSGGEQQMLAIARALMARPRILLLDEPSLGLAPRIVRQIFDLIASLKEQGMTILLVEQNATQALKLADYAYLMSSGRIVAHGTADELGKSDRLMAELTGVA